MNFFTHYALYESFLLSYKYLLTKSRIVKESISLEFSYRLSDEGARSVRENRRQILPSTVRANEVNIKNLWLLVGVLSHFNFNRDCVV